MQKGVVRRVIAKGGSVVNDKTNEILILFCTPMIPQSRRKRGRKKQTKTREPVMVKR